MHCFMMFGHCLLICDYKFEGYLMLLLTYFVVFFCSSMQVHWFTPLGILVMRIWRLVVSNIFNRNTKKRYGFPLCYLHLSFVESKFFLVELAVFIVESEDVR
jgi:hypothetical protein